MDQIMAKPRKAENHMITGKRILKVGGSNFKLPAMTAPWARWTSTSLTGPERAPMPRAGEIIPVGWWSRLDTCQDYFFSVSQQDIDRLKASIREQTDPLHDREPIPDVILIVRRIAEEAIIVAQ